MRQIKFRGVFKVGDNDYYSEDEKNYIESKQHDILSISIGIGRLVFGMQE